MHKSPHILNTNLLKVILCTKITASFSVCIQCITLKEVYTDCSFFNKNTFSCTTYKIKNIINKKNIADFDSWNKRGPKSIQANPHKEQQGCQHTLNSAVIILSKIKWGFCWLNVARKLCQTQVHYRVGFQNQQRALSKE